MVSCQLIINLHTMMFCVPLLPLTPFFSQGPDFTHCGFIVCTVSKNVTLVKSKGLLYGIKLTPTLWIKVASI